MVWAVAPVGRVAAQEGPAPALMLLVECSSPRLFQLGQMCRQAQAGEQERGPALSVASREEPVEPLPLAVLAMSRVSHWAVLPMKKGWRLLADKPVAGSHYRWSEGGSAADTDQPNSMNRAGAEYYRSHPDKRGRRSVGRIPGRRHSVSPNRLENFLSAIADPLEASGRHRPATIAAIVQDKPAADARCDPLPEPWSWGPVWWCFAKDMASSRLSFPTPAPQYPCTVLKVYSFGFPLACLTVS